MKEDQRGARPRDGAILRDGIRGRPELGLALREEDGLPSIDVVVEVDDEGQVTLLGVAAHESVIEMRLEVLADSIPPESPTLVDALRMHLPRRKATAAVADPHFLRQMFQDALIERLNRFWWSMPHHTMCVA